MDAAQNTKIGKRKTRSAARGADPRSPCLNGLRALYSDQPIHLSAGSALDSGDSGNRSAYPDRSDSSTAAGPEFLNALVMMYFVDQLRVLAASLSELARVLFLGQMLGASLFLFWLLRSRHLRTATPETNVRFLPAIRAIAKIGLVFLPAAFLANVLGYVNLGNLLGMFCWRKTSIVIYVLQAAFRTRSQRCFTM
jgi:hypothetical protein